MRKSGFLLIGIVIGAIVALLFFHHKTSEPVVSPKSNTEQNVTVAKALANQNSNTVAIIESNFAQVQPPPANLGLQLPFLRRPPGRRMRCNLPTSNRKS